MSDVIEQLLRAGDDLPEEYRSRSRGRPKRSREATGAVELRRAAFGEKLRSLRNAAGLSINKAAQVAGIATPRRISQYEGVSYPPGAMVRLLARAYGVDERMLSRLVLAHSDPDLFEAVTGEPADSITGEIPR